MKNFSIEARRETPSRNWSRLAERNVRAVVDTPSDRPVEPDAHAFQRLLTVVGRQPPGGHPDTGNSEMGKIPADGTATVDSTGFGEG